MSYRFQFRRDKEENWQGVVLTDGEIGLLQTSDGRNTNLYKVGDGKTKWEDLALFGFNGTLSDLVQGENDSKCAVSKDVLIGKFNDIGNDISGINDRIDESNDNITSQGKSLEEFKEETNTSITNLNNSLNTNTTAIDENKDAINTINDQIIALNEKHIVLPKETWDVGIDVKEGVFYYLYEE